MCSSLLNALRKYTLNYSEAVCLARSRHEAPTLIPCSQELKAGECGCRKEEGCEHTLAAAGEVFWFCLAAVWGETPLLSMGCCAAMLRWDSPSPSPGACFWKSGSFSSSQA